MFFEIARYNGISVRAAGRATALFVIAAQAGLNLMVSKGRLKPYRNSHKRGAGTRGTGSGRS